MLRHSACEVCGQGSCKCGAKLFSSRFDVAAWTAASKRHPPTKVRKNDANRAIFKSGTEGLVIFLTRARDVGQMRTGSVFKKSIENNRLFNIFVFLGFLYVPYIYLARLGLEKLGINTVENFSIAVYSVHVLTTIWFVLYVKTRFKLLWISAYRMRLRFLGNGVGAIVYGVTGILFFGAAYVFFNFISYSSEFTKFLSHSSRIGLRDIAFPYLSLLIANFLIMRLIFKICAYRKAR